MSLKDADEGTRQAERIALRLITFRARSEQELRCRLDLKRIPKKAIEQTIQRLKRSGLINDKQFAKEYTRSRFLQNFGPNRIRCELTQKGIAKKVIDQELSIIKESYSEHNLLKDLITKRIKHYRGLQPLIIKRRLYGYLVRRGFDTDTVIQALDQL